MSGVGIKYLNLLKAFFGIFRHLEMKSSDNGNLAEEHDTNDHSELTDQGTPAEVRESSTIICFYLKYVVFLETNGYG